MKEEEEDERIEFLVYISTCFSSLPPSIIVYNYILKKELPQTSPQDFFKPNHMVPAAFLCIPVL